MILEKLLGTSHARVYRHLARRLGEGLIEAEVVAATAVSRSAVNVAVRDLTKAGLIRRQARGRVGFYSADPADPVVRQFKVWETTVQLVSTVARLVSVARRVVLYGSAAQGIDTAESDLDLFIVGTDKRAIRQALEPSIDGRRLQAVVVTEQELASLKSEDPVFYAQVREGLVLLEAAAGQTEP